MSENTSIEWTDHTFNPWSGCTKVSAGCANCYAANLPPAMRRHAEWGPNAPRVRASESYLNEPRKWNRKAEKEGVRRRVFCASVADVFEARADLDPWREDLLSLIAETPWLDWQLLTKRPEYAERFLRGRKLPGNLWIGTSVENQEAADERIPWLLKIPAKVRFLSCEPLLGPVDLGNLWCHNCSTDEHVRFEPPSQPWCIECDSEVGPAGWLDACANENQAGINLVIVGGESGRKARPMHPDWARSMRDQCKAAGVPFFFKQWGEWRGHNCRAGCLNRSESEQFCKMTTIPHKTWCGRSFEENGQIITEETRSYRIGKHAAGSDLDGRQHKEFP